MSSIRLAVLAALLLPPCSLLARRRKPTRPSKSPRNRNARTSSSTRSSTKTWRGIRSSRRSSGSRSTTTSGRIFPMPRTRPTSRSALENLAKLKRDFDFNALDPQTQLSWRLFEQDVERNAEGFRYRFDNYPGEPDVWLAHLDADVPDEHSSHRQRVGCGGLHRALQRRGRRRPIR